MCATITTESIKVLSSDVQSWDLHKPGATTTIKNMLYDLKYYKKTEEQSILTVAGGIMQPFRSNLEVPKQCALCINSDMYNTGVKSLQDK